MRDYNLLFADLGDLYFEKVQSLILKLPFEINISGVLLQETCYCLLYTIGMSYLNSHNLKSDIIAFSNFQKSLFEAQFPEKEFDTKFQDKIIKISSVFVTAKNLDKNRVRNFFDEYEPYINNAGQMGELYNCITNPVVKKFSNIFGNIIFYPDFIEKIDAASSSSPFEKCIKSFKTYIVEEVAVSTVFPLFDFFELNFK